MTGTAPRKQNCPSICQKYVGIAFGLLWFFSCALTGWAAGDRGPQERQWGHASGTPFPRSSSPDIRTTLAYSGVSDAQVLSLIHISEPTRPY